MSNIIGWNVFCNIIRSFAIAKERQNLCKRLIRRFFCQILLFFRKKLMLPNAIYVCDKPLNNIHVSLRYMLLERSWIIA